MKPDELTLTEMKPLLSSLPIPSSEERPLSMDDRIRQYGRLSGQLGRRYHQITFDDYEIYDRTNPKKGGNSRPSQEQVVQQVKQFCEQMQDRLAAGGGLVLFGPPGTGKDHLMACCMYWATLKYGLRVLWRNGSMLGQEMRERISSGSSESEFVKHFVDPQILALSDPAPPRGEATNYFVDTLQRIVDRRYAARKSTWVTINAKDGRDAEDRLSPALVDRLRHDSLVLECRWRSYRKAK